MMASLQQNQVCNIRPGTINYGPEYEVSIAALLCLRCATETTQEMSLMRNAPGCGAFDDVVLCRTDSANNVISYLIQLKHKVDRASIKYSDYNEKDFYLTKYFNSIKKIKTKGNTIFKNPNFIIFTNRAADKCDFLIKPEKDDENKLSFVSTTHHMFQFDCKKLPSIFQSSDTEIFCKKLFLLPMQVSVGDELKELISQELKDIIHPLELSPVELFHTSDRLVSFIDHWSKGELGGSYYLSKEIVLKVLGEILLDSYMVKFSTVAPTCTNNRFDIWKEILDEFSMMVVSSDYIVEKFLIAHNYVEVQKYLQGPSLDLNIMKKDTHRSITKTASTSSENVYEYLWKTGRLPLILRAKDQCEIQKIKNIFQLCGRFFKIIILNKIKGKIETDSFWNIFLITFKDLADNIQEKIKNCPVKLQDRESTVTLGQYSVVESMKSLELHHIIYILSFKFNIGNDFESPPRFFVKRSLEKIWLTATVLKTSSERFVIKCKSHSNFRTFLETHRINIQEENVVYLDKNSDLPTQDFKVIIVPFEYNLLTHLVPDCHYLLLHGNSHLEWLKSYPSTANILRDIREFKFPNENSNVLETCGINLKNSVPLVISANPGMGKSMLMDFISLNVPDNVWVVRVNLGDHFKYYNRDAFLDLGSPQHLLYFNNKQFKREDCQRDLDLAVFQYHLKAKTVLILFDGFDEILGNCQRKVMIMIKKIHDDGYTMCTTTRPILKIQLENLLGTLAVTLNPFTEADQESFLVKYFNEKTADSTPKLGKEFAVKLLRYTKKNLNDDDQQYAGVPLQTMLLADLFVDKEFVKGDFTNENFDIIDLYDKFFEKKRNVAIKKPGFGTVTYLDSYEKHRVDYALKLLFDPKDVDSLINENEMLNIHPDTLLILQADGIIGFKDSSNPYFVHRTFAEYLVAKWLSAKMSDESRDTVKNLLKAMFQPRMTFMRMLFDRILAKNCPLLTAVIRRQVEEVESIIKSNAEALDQKDKGGRSLLHLIAAWGVQHPFSISDTEIDSLQKVVCKDNMVNILKLVSKANIFHNRQDKLLNYTPLDYAINTGSLFVADEISSRLEDFQDCISNASTDIEYIEPYFEYFSYGSLRSVLLRHTIMADFNINSERVDTWRFTPLHNAFIFGTLLEDRSSHLLDFIDKADHTGKTVLHWASTRGSADDVSWLLSNGACVNIEDNKSRTALHYAVIAFKNNEIGIIRLLLHNEATMSNVDVKGKTAFHYAVHYNITEALKLLLVSKGEPNLPKTLSTQDVDGMAPLHYAAEKGHLGNMKLLVEYGKDTELADSYNLTALHWAATNGHTNAVKFLLDKKANIEAKEKEYNRTPLIFAAQNGHMDIVQLLLLHKADLAGMDVGGWTALHWAARSGHVDVLKFLVDQKADFEAKDVEELTPLHWAARNGHLDVLTFLLEKNADFEAKDVEELTPLHWAAYMGHIDLVKELLARGANIQAKTKEGLTAIDFANSEGHVDVQAALSAAMKIGT